MNKSQIQSLLDRFNIVGSEELATELYKSRAIYKEKVAPYAWRAPFVMWGVCRSLPWGAESLPEKYRPYDNNISINGDRGRWSLDSGKMTRLPVPLAKWNSEIGDGDTRLYQYWTFAKLSARHWFSRWVWLGIRNRACMAAVDAGVAVHAPSADVSVAATTSANGKERLVVRALRNGVDSAYQLQYTKIVGPFHIRLNLGYKLDCLNQIDRVAPVVWVPFAMKIRFNKKFDI